MRTPVTATALRQERELEQLGHRRDLARPNGFVALANIPALDGLRGLAVAAVLLYHAELGVVPGGFLGVSTFFTLSGFLITSLLLVAAGGVATGEATAGRSIVAFWGRRVRRLVPASMAGVLLAVVITATTGTADQRSGLLGDVVAALTDVANWRFLLSGRSYGDQFGAPSLLQHHWSLAIEEQFYLAYPLLVVAVGVSLAGGRSARPRRDVHAIVRRVGVLIAVLLALSVASSVRHLGDVDRIYFGTDTRAAEVLLGCLLAVVLARRGQVASITSPGARRSARAVGACALVITIAGWLLVRLDHPAVAGGGLLVYGLVSVGLLAGAVVPGPLASALAWRPLRLLGQVSFGVYVYHWPIFGLVNPSRTGLTGWPLLAPRLAATFAVALLSFHLLERPIRSGRALVARPRGRVLVPSVAAVLVAVAMLTTITAPPRFDYAAAEELFAGELDQFDDGAAAPGSSRPALSPPLPLDESPVPAPWVAVLGDYSAINIANSLLLRQAQRRDASYSEGVLDRHCSLLRGTKVRDVNGEHGNAEKCDDRASTWKDVLAVTGSDVAVVSMGVQDLLERDLDGDGTWRTVGDPEFDARIASELDQVIESSSAANVAVLANLPTDWSVLGPERPWLLDAATYRARATRMNELIAAAAARHPGVVVLDTDRWFADGGGAAFRPDGVHADEERWAAFAEWIAASVIEANRAATMARRIAEAAAAASAGSRPVRVLVVGDSTALALAVGLRGHAAATHDIQVASVARSGCGLAFGGIKRDRWAEVVDDCVDDTGVLVDAVDRFRPDVVLVVDTLWEINDRKIPGDDTWRAIGDPVYDEFLRERLRRVFEVVTAKGARLAVVLYPRLELGRGDPAPPAEPYPVNQPERMARYHDLLRSLAAERRGAVVDLAGWMRGRPGGELDAAQRRDGVHFTAEAARVVADSWLAAEIVAAAPMAGPTPVPPT